MSLPSISYANTIANLNSCSLLVIILMRLGKFLVPQSKIIKFIALIFLVNIFLFVPIYHKFTLVEITRGIVGDLSITGLILSLSLVITYFMGNNLRDILPKRLCMILILCGLFLYLSTFGYISVDIYHFGFRPNLYMLSIVFCLEILIWFISKVFGIIWLLACLAFYLKLQLSLNLWDYLFDPIVWFLAIYALFTNGRNSQSDS